MTKEIFGSVLHGKDLLSELLFNANSRRNYLQE